MPSNKRMCPPPLSFISLFHDWSLGWPLRRNVCGRGQWSRPEWLNWEEIFGSGHRWSLSLPGVAKHTGLGIKAVRAMRENAEWCPVLPTSPSPSLYTSPARSPQVQFSNCLQSANLGASFNQLLINFGLLFYVRTSDLKWNGISVLTCSESRCSCCLMTLRFI